MKRRKEKAKEARGMSLDMPDRFRSGDDADQDVTAPKRSDTVSMNQSLFSMIARAGQQSQVDLGAMQEVDSGDSDNDEGKRRSPYHSLDGAARISRLSTANDFQAPPVEPQDARAGQGRHRRALSENKLLRSLPKLKMAGRRESKTDVQPADQMSSSQFLPPRPSIEPQTTPAGELPSRPKSKITPDEDIQVEQGRTSGKRSRHGSSAAATTSKEPVTLAKRIQHIFEFEHVEEVISEYPCWLLQSILLQGYMYITQKHVCFYAYIPKKHVSLSIDSRSNTPLMLTNVHSTMLAKLAICTSAAGRSTTVTGSSCAVTYFHTIPTQPSYTSLGIDSTYGMPSRLR